MGLGGKFTRVESRYLFTRRVSVDHADDMRLQKTSIIRVLHDEPEKRLARLLFHVAAGKFLGAPWGRKVARHFAGPRRVNAAHSSIPNHHVRLRLAIACPTVNRSPLCCYFTSPRLIHSAWPCPKYANPPHGGPRAILQLQSLRWSTIAAATMSRSILLRADEVIE